MESLLNLFKAIDDAVWGPAMLVVLGCAGIYLTVGLRFIQFRKIGYAFSELFKQHENDDSLGDISPFKSLMTALSATVGTGNIAGVATAIFLGGPGAIFYMWMIALIGMATKYSECMLGVEYREKNENGEHLGGPMYYMKKGIGGSLGTALGGIWAVLLVIGAFGIGNSAQSNSLAKGIEATFGITPLLTGVALAVIVALVIIGGVKRIADVAGKLVPAMFVAYVIAGLIVILINISQIGHALGLIFQHAFTPHAAVGGFAGAAVAQAIQYGVARGVFSNESGLGSAPIAHAAAQTKNPVRQAHIAMLGTFIDTIIICTITALAIIMTGAYTSGDSGVAMTIIAFSSVFGTFGGVLVNIILSVFVFTTIIAWSFYGERGLGYLGVGNTGIFIYRSIWVALIVASATASLNLVWTFSSATIGLLVYPNVLALIWLSPKIFNKTKDFWEK